jgi:hypothetical protein
VADALVHILGVIAAIAGAGILLVMVTAKSDTASIIAAAIFGFGFFASLTLSAAHNIVETKKWKPILKRTDQCGHLSAYRLRIFSVRIDCGRWPDQLRPSDLCLARSNCWYGAEC